MPHLVSSLVRTKYWVKFTSVSTVLVLSCIFLMFYSDNQTLSSSSSSSSVSDEYVWYLEQKIAKLEIQKCKRNEDKSSKDLITEKDMDYLIPWHSPGTKVAKSDECLSKKQVAFAKTHKTGSSTLQNILLRFSVKNELNIVLPPKNWMFSFKEPFDANVVLEGPWSGLSYDMFLFHSVWNYAEVKKLLPTAKYITILRDPVEDFESNYVYMGLERAFKMDINGFAVNKAAKGFKRTAKTIIGRNQLLWDLGLPYDQMDNASLVTEKIAKIEEEFDLVLIVEHFEESLILMKDLLCWNMEDVVFLKQNERMQTAKSNITEKTRAILKDWLWADYVLYDHFHKKLFEQVSKFSEERMKAEKNRLNTFNDKLRVACVKEKAGNEKLSGEFRMALPTVYGYVIDESKPWCTIYARSEPNFYKQLQQVQTLRLNMLKLKGLVKV
jgi:hypothetical protein